MAYIDIYLLRVSPDSKYLDISAHCPANYEFNQLLVTKYDVEQKAWENTTTDASQLVLEKTDIVLKIDMNAFGSDVTMYKVVLGAAPIEGSGLTELIEQTGICSNTNFVYANLLDLIMRMTNCCISDYDYDNLDRNHMILYAHMEAMRLGRETDAIFFYDLIWNLFTNCGPTTRQNNMINKPCNCE